MSYRDKYLARKTRRAARDNEDLIYYNEKKNSSKLESQDKIIEQLNDRITVLRNMLLEAQKDNIVVLTNHKKAIEQLNKEVEKINDCINKAAMKYIPTSKEVN